MQLLGRPVGLDQPLFLIAGPCVIESEALQLGTAETLKRITDKLGILFIFKSSFDKANRSSGSSFRGPGLDEGLRILEKVRETLGVPVLTDVHDIPQIKPVAEVVDVLQTPAFLARQTDFITAVASAGRPVNIKKGQFMAPHDMVNVVDKGDDSPIHRLDVAGRINFTQQSVPLIMLDERFGVRAVDFEPLANGCVIVVGPRFDLPPSA
jgi:2-dehydro-3-deoxyphosphooctonate aldolase (KDO 8-P synthase)